MTEIVGLAGSPGFAAGNVVLLEVEDIQPEKQPGGPLAEEIEKLRRERGRYKLILEELAKVAQNETNRDAAAIFAAQAEIVDDAVFFEDVEALIETEEASAAWALDQKRAEAVSSFSKLKDEYLRQRADDVENVCRELTCRLLGKKRARFSEAPKSDDLVLVANDLTPADTIRLDKKTLRGFVTEKGGPTSHTVILAKGLGIPAVVGAAGIIDTAKNGEMALVDGDTGRVVLSPDAAELQGFSEKILFSRERAALYKAAEGKVARTLDGKEIHVCINVGSEESLLALDPAACDGVGLYRTEFLFMGREEAPTEDEQFERYRQAAERARDMPLTIRTLDIGGDKEAPYLGLPSEANPFLGYRAIRICLGWEEFFLTQLRAILRASVYGNVRLMFPMIVTLEELLQAKELLKKAQEQLDKEGVDYNKEMPVGIMVETPAAVLLCDRLCPKVDFLSIGTNDLTQYTTATDRMNERVQYLFDNCNISVLRSVGMVCEAAERHGVPVAICGESGSDPLLVPLWAGLGVTELSVSPALVGRTKTILSRLDSVEMQRQAQHILSSFGEIEKVKEQLRKIYADLRL